MVTTPPTGVPAHASTTSPTPCRPWCDHDGRFPTVHESAKATLPGPAALATGREALLEVRTSIDDDFMGTPGVVIKHADNGVSVSPASAMAFARELVAFAEQVYRAAEQAKAVAA